MHGFRNDTTFLIDDLLLACPKTGESCRGNASFKIPTGENEREKNPTKAMKLEKKVIKGKLISSAM